MTASSRRSHVERNTAETRIVVDVDIDGSGQCRVSTGLPFFDHMLDQLGRHGGFDLSVACVGDLQVDAHHSVEDVAIAIGEALRAAWGDKRGVRRFASGLFPLDEALVEVALDLSGRPFAVIDLPVGYPDGTPALPLGQPPFNPEMTDHFFVSLANSAGITLHVSRRCGRNTHHVIEASFKGVARCLRDALRVEGSSVPSTKGSL